MSRRFFDTDEWNDPWFLGLPFEAKLAAHFLAAHCDCAGFWVVDYELMSKKTGLPLGGTHVLRTDRVLTVQDAMEECRANLIWRDDGILVYLTCFLRQQGNWPLKENSPAHKGIIHRFDYWGAFGLKIYRLLIEQQSSTTVSEVFLRETKKEGNPSHTVNKQYEKGTSKSNGNGNKGGVGGKLCCRCESEGRRTPGIHLRINKQTDQPYYLCADCEHLAASR